MTDTNQLPELLLEFDEWQRNTPRKLPEHLTDILRSALQARAQVQGEPVYWEWRHLSTHPDTVDFGKWSEWKRVEARSAIHTIEDALAEFRAYIAQGYKYELRALYTTPQATPVCGAQNAESDPQAPLSLTAAPQQATPDDMKVYASIADRYFREATQAEAQQPAAQTEREAFEAGLRCEETWGHRSLKRRPDGRYQNWRVDLMWDLWKARAPLPAPQQPATGEPVAWRNVIPGGRKTDEWESTRIADYNLGWNAYRKAAKTALEHLETSTQPLPSAWMYTLEYGGTIADTKVSLRQLNYPFGVCGADYLRENSDGISYVRQTPLYTHSAPSVPATPEPVMDVRCEGCGYMTHHREHMGCVRAAKQHTRPVPSVPDGYVLVPIEPTQAMMNVQTWDFSSFYSPREIWAAMLAAKDPK